MEIPVRKEIWFRNTYSKRGFECFEKEAAICQREKSQQQRGMDTLSFRCCVRSNIECQYYLLPWLLVKLAELPWHPGQFHPLLCSWGWRLIAKCPSVSKGPATALLTPEKQVWVPHQPAELFKQANHILLWGPWVTSPSWYYKDCLPQTYIFTLFLSAIPKWPCGSLSPPGCECIWLIHCCHPHLPSARWFMIGHSNKPRVGILPSLMKQIGGNWTNNIIKEYLLLSKCF